MKTTSFLQTFAGALALLVAPRAGAQVRPPTPPPPGATEGHEADIAAGQAAAQTWLALLDAGEYGKSWREAASYFQTLLSEGQWAGGLAGRRLKRGKALSRNLVVARYSPTVPGGSPGRYVFLLFQTQFEDKTSATETVVPMLDKDGRWKVAGYYLK